MKEKPRQTPKSERNAKIAANQKLRRKVNQARLTKFETLVKDSDAVLMNPKHPDWKPGTARLLTDLRKSEDEL